MVDALLLIPFYLLHWYLSFLWGYICSSFVKFTSLQSLFNLINWLQIKFEIGRRSSKLSTLLLVASFKIDLGIWAVCFNLNFFLIWLSIVCLVPMLLMGSRNCDWLSSVLANKKGLYLCKCWIFGRNCSVVAFLLYLDWMVKGLLCYMLSIVVCCWSVTNVSYVCYVLASNLV